MANHMIDGQNPGNQLGWRKHWDIFLLDPLVQDIVELI